MMSKIGIKAISQTVASRPQLRVCTASQKRRYWQRGMLRQSGLFHTGKPLSFVYDVADIYKFETVVPLAFRIAAKNPPNAEQQVRLACRDKFRETKLLERIIPGIEEMLAAGEIPRPAPFEEQVLPAIPNQDNIGDAGHRT
jgi:CRISPR-associated protein Cas1